MKAAKSNLAVSMVTLAVHGALAAFAAMPVAALADEDQDVAALTQPTNSVEIGAENTSHASAKYGEYSGLHKSGPDAIINFNLRGGDAYGMGEGTTRWSVTGTDLGTTARSAGATVSDQGRWNFGLNYDELRHYITDSYQTPLQGAMGGSSFFLPQAFGVVNTQTKPAAVGGVIPPYGAQALTDNQKTYFHKEEVWSGRKNTGITAGVNLDREWSVQFEFNHLDQDGAKLMSVGTDVQNKGGFSAVRGENILVLMNPTNFKTDTANLALNWVGEKGHFTGSYYGSSFRNAHNSVSFSNPYTGNSVGLATGTAPATPFPIDTMSTAPDNDFHQLNLTGGYAIRPTTKLVGGVSYARNTQNVGFINADQMQAGGLPQSSLNGLVVNTHADLKLTDQTTKDLVLTAGVKYNERDNRTAANTYKFLDLGGGAVTSVSTPMSNRKTQVELAGDYRIDRRQNVHLGYEYEQINRWCNDSLANNAQGPGPGGPSVSAAAYYTAASCAQVRESDENKLVASYKLKASDDLSLSAGYAYSKRKADVNSSFYNPMQGHAEGYELPGYRVFSDASRTEQMAKLGVNWQASEKLNMSVGGRYAHDDYTDSALGVQGGHAWSLNVDGSYSLGEKSSLSAFLSVQKRQRDLLNAAWNHATGTYFSPDGRTWLNSLDQDDFTFGLSLKEGGLMGGKLNVAGDFTYSLARSTYSTSLRYANAACTAPSNSGYACGVLPDIYSKLLQFKLVGDYLVDKSSTVVVGYIYQHLGSNDYFYNAYQMGYTPTSLMPTNQVAPTYSASTLFAAYRYSFQ